MSQRMLVVASLISLALSGCEYQQWRRPVQSMTPSDLELLSQEDLNRVCWAYLSDSEAAGSVRDFRKPGSWWRSELPLVDSTPLPLANPDEVLSKLDQVDTWIRQWEERMEQVRTACGRCFGVGYKGEAIRKECDDGMAFVAELKAQIAVLKERVRAKEEECKRTVQWRQAYADILTYKDSQIELEIIDISVIAHKESSVSFRSRTMIVPSFAQTELSIKLTAMDEGKILWPCNQQIWGYDTHPDLGGSFPIGASLRDNLGNELRLISFKPSYYNRGRGLHAGDTEDFKVVFSDYPVKKATSVSLRFQPGVFGQARTISFDLPLHVFAKDRQDITE